MPARHKSWDMSKDHSPPHSLLLCTRYHYNDHHLNRQLFFLGLMKWDNPVIPHQRQSSPIGQTRVGFVAYAHDCSHWFIHHKSCPHYTHDTHPYPQRGTGQQYHLLGLNSLSRNHQLTIVRLQWLIIRVLTPHLEDAHEPRHTRPNPFALPPCRLHNRLLGIQRVLLEAHSPHHHVAEEIPSRRHKASPTTHRDQFFVSTIFFESPWHQYCKEFTYRNVSITLQPHLNIP